MAIGYGVACPKGKTRTQIKAKRDREDAAKLKAFRDAVWKRESAKYSVTADTGSDSARCQRCGYFVIRLPGYMSGEVHHRIGRRNKATRYDPDNGVLLCNALVNDCHGKAQRGEIAV